MSGKTKTAIQKAFLQLLAEKPLSAIGVRDITDACGISRNTFYYHYKDISALLDEMVAQIADVLIAASTAEDGGGSCVSNAYLLAAENKNAVKNIYASLDRETYETFLMRMCRHTASTHVSHLLTGHSVPPKTRERLVHFLQCELFGECAEWIRGGMTGNFTEIYRQSLSSFFSIAGTLPEAQ